eukprot:jgi/Mesen1/9356/ME000061S08800
MGNVDKEPAGEYSSRTAPHKLSLSRPWNGMLGNPSNMKEVKDDDELKRVMQEARAAKRTLVVNYGASWCHACSQMAPTFWNISNEFQRPLFVYADVDKCTVSTDEIKYTPTFRFYRDGEKVDEFFGAGPQRLRDRVWLQS